MGFCLPGIRKTSVAENKLAPSKAVEVPKATLHKPSFHDMLNQAEEEFGYEHPMGGLTIPCKKDEFLTVACHLNDL
ncbi:Auxin-induced protein X10A [Glycine soja]|uniref:Auxin-induced protein n=2 Tax=Glycine subgen. Soja TaxID=1462606 RepID=A0A0R0HF89_SOYBN|nr:Auxin-induced protein X10A [Glycine soja]